MIEVLASLLTLLLAMAICGYVFYLASEVMRRDPDFPVSAFVLNSIVFLAPPACLVIGAYFHVFKEKIWGYLLLLVFAAVNDFMILALVLNGIGFFFTGWALLLISMEFVAVLAAVAAAIRTSKLREMLADGVSE